MGFPTIMDVAARAGVSKSSVSRVLQGSPLVSEEARAAVQAAIEELGYRPNAAARTLAGRQSHSIGVLVSDLHNPFFPMVLDGIDAVAEEHGYTSLIVRGKRRSQTEEHALGRLLELQVDGIVAVTERLSRAAVVEAARSAPLVMLTQTPRIPRVDSVVSDNREGAKLVIDHLVALGHAGIAMIADARGHAGAERIEGYQAAMNGHRLARQVRVVSAPPTERSGYDVTRELLTDAGPATAIFAGNDLCALGVLDALAEHGIQVPRDMSVAGYDNTAVAALRSVSLTTVQQFASEIGAEATRSVLARMEWRDRPARHVLVPPASSSALPPPRRDPTPMVPARGRSDTYRLPSTHLRGWISGDSRRPEGLEGQQPRRVVLQNDPKDGRADGFFDPGKEPGSQIAEAGHAAVGMVAGAPGDVASEEQAVRSYATDYRLQAADERGIRSLTVTRHAVVAKVCPAGHQFELPAGVKVAIGVGQDHPFGGYALGAQQIQDLVRGRAMLQVNHDRRSGASVGAADGRDDQALEAGDPPVADSGFEHPGADTGAVRAISGPSGT
jgi:DNA-binding LacI/PurR family transcriptional regulator